MADLLHQDHPERWPVTDEARARWVGARVRINASNRPAHPWAGREGQVVGVWRGAGFAGVWHIMLDDGVQFGAFTGELDRLGDAHDELDTGKPPCDFCRREVPCECAGEPCMCTCGRCMAEPLPDDRKPMA